MAFWYKKLGLGVLLLSLEIISFVLEQIGGSSRLFLIALFLLSATGFVTTIYTSFFGSTVPAVTRSEPERQLIAVDIFFSFIQLVLTFIQLIRVFSGAKINKNNDDSLLPLAFAVISVVFIFRNTDSASVNQTIHRNDEEAQVSSDSGSVNQIPPAVDDESTINRESSTLRQRTTSREVKEYRLLFVNKLHKIIYTKDKIRDDDGGYVKIKLIDANSGKREKVSRLSSIEIEIVILEGDFGFEGHENWTEQEFNAKIIHQRGDKPLVKGKQNITLRDGVGSIDDLSFSVNSGWIKCQKFKLGARVVQSSSNMGQVRIKEAITEAFMVIDQRGKRKF